MMDLLTSIPQWLPAKTNYNLKNVSFSANIAINIKANIFKTISEVKIIGKGPCKSNNRKRKGPKNVNTTSSHRMKAEVE